VLLLYARTPAEEGAVSTWLRDSGRAGTASVPAGHGALAPWIAEHDASDPEVVPVRVAWLPRERGGDRMARVRDVMLLRDPRRPSPAAQEQIARSDPERCRVVVGESARVSELRRRYASGGGESFEAFVERQGVLALERAEREVVGNRYKVPRLVQEDVIASQAFRETVARFAAESGRSVAEVGEEAERCLEEMVASQSRLAIDAWDHFGRWLARAYTIDVDASRIDELHRLNRSSALIFLPSHRSYLDPLILRPVLQRHGFPPNHTLGGNNVDFWPVGSVARRNGYVFIRRSMKDAPLYKAVLREYLGYLVRKRFNLEWYIEGGRTRTGKLRPPRHGILNYVIDAYERSGVDDVVLVPVSIAYDQLHEVGAMAAEEHGAKKQAEGLSWIVGYGRAQGRSFGAVHVAFGEPLSLAESLRADGTVPKVALEVMHRINSVAPITPSAIVTLALLGGDGRALTIGEGRALLGPLLEYVEARDLPSVEGIGVGRTEVATAALGRLVREGIVSEYVGGDEPVYEIPRGKHVEAAFYRNNVVHHFVTRAITELALAHAAEGGFDDTVAEVWDEALRLRDLLKFEFFFANKRAFDHDVRAEMALLDPGWERRSGTGAIREGLEQAPMLLAPRVLGPFLEAYEVVADRLAAQDPGLPCDEEAFVKACLGAGRQYVLQHRVDSPESVSRELFRTALQLAAHRGLLEPGAADLRSRREAFAAEIRDVVQRIRVLRALAAGDDGKAPWAGSPS